MFGIPSPFDVVILSVLIFLVLLLGFLYWKACKENKRLLELSSIDPLTGIKNRRSFNETLASFLALLPSNRHDVRSGRMSGGLGLFMLDVDHFKSINDTYGHAVGDVVLTAVAATISKHVRTTDLVGRYGGEEFMVAIPVVNIDDLKVTAENLRTAIKVEVSDKLRTVIGGFVSEEEVNVTVSIGALHIPYHQEASVLVKMADKAMYEAKGAGRDRVTFISLEGS